MKKILTQYGVCALAVALMVPLAQAQPVGIQAAFGKDAGTLSDKFTRLARVMSGKYDWKPGRGVRSVGDVFNLIVTENRMLVGVLFGSHLCRRRKTAMLRLPSQIIANLESIREGPVR
jgi:hypothetical protein